MCINNLRAKPVPSYSVNNTILDTADSLRLLGATISRDLSWNCNTNNKCNTVWDLLEPLRVVRIKNYVLLKLCQNLILQILNYRAHVWQVYIKKYNLNQVIVVEQGWFFVNG